MFWTSQCISLVFPWNWKSLSHVWLFVTPMDYTVYEILQARILERIAIPYSSRSSWPMNPTRVSWIAGRLFISWAIREALCFLDEIYSDVFLLRFWWDFFFAFHFWYLIVNIKRCTWFLYVNLVSCYLDKFIVWDL